MQDEMCLFLITGSKSAQFEKDASQAEKSKYSRAISVPVQDEERGLDGNLKLYDNERGFAFSNVGSEDLGHNRRRITGTQVCVLCCCLIRIPCKVTHPVVLEITFHYDDVFAR